MHDGSEFERLAGYARAVRVGAHIAVSGTAAMSEGVVLHPGDAYGQTREAIAKALAAAAELGASVRGRDPDAAPARRRLRLARGRPRARRGIRRIDPANTTYFVAGFIPEGVLVEVELDAIVID